MPVFIQQPATSQYETEDITTGIRKCYIQLQNLIMSLFDTSLHQGRIHSAWKKAKHGLLFKKKRGNKKQTINYWSISIMSVVIKLFEKIIRKKMVAFLEVNKIIMENQQGFRSNRSCLTELLDLFNDVSANYDVRLPYDTIYFDFQGACETLPDTRSTQHYSLV